MLRRSLHFALLAVTFPVMASCVQTRPARNAVFNENQYLQKSLLIGSPTASTPDLGWWLKGTIVQVSTPNPLGASGWGNSALSPGIDSGAIPVRFVVTEDKLQMVSTREESPTDAQSPEVTPAVLNAWPITNVDLMYYTNLDGELTNQYVTNQEAPWQQREWVQVNFDKNDMSDLAPLGEPTWNLFANCIDTGNVSTTLVPNSLVVYQDPDNFYNDYIQWTVSVTLPLIWDDSTCVFAYGDLGQNALQLGKTGVTINLMYSMERVKPLPATDGGASDPNAVTYQPLVVGETDGIQHKYGFLNNITWNLDPNTQQLAAQQQVIRFDPQKPITWYFAQGFNPAYKHFFTDPGTGIVDRTNAVMQAAGAAARIAVKDYDDPEGLAPGQGPRQYGDIRYNFLVWMTDQFSQETFAGVTIPVVDYRTGESMAANIAFNQFAFQDYYIQRINDYLLSVGAADDVNTPGEWPATPTVAEGPGITDPSQDPQLANCTTAPSQNSCAVTVTGPNLSSTTLNCAAGSTLPIETVQVAALHNGTSTVFGKMQQYLGYPTSTFGNLGPSDFIAPTSQQNDPDFFNAYYTLIPYITYADPAMNPYVIPEGGNGTFGPPSALSDWARLQQEVQFQAAAANLNAGQGTGWPYVGATGTPSVVEAAQGADNFRQLVQAHHDFKYMGIMSNLQYGIHLDGVDSLAFENVADQTARACGVDTAGQWQTKEGWVNDKTQAYWNQVMFHEFGHSLGLQHNFMGSIDAPHYPAIPVGNDATGNPATQQECNQNPIQQGCVPQEHTSSVMEYQSEIDRVTFQNPDWGPYDKGAIAWIYANTAPSGTPCSTAGCSISGQNSATSPWNDPLGFTVDQNGNSVEMKFLFCDEYHMQYTPLCRMDDLGRTPSEIISNQLDAYEWQYQWRNLRQYHKFWNDSTYANSPENLFNDLQRMVSMWAFDWSNTELATTLRRIGITNPSPSTQSDQDYFNQLSNKFESEISAANQMSAAYHIAMINQAQSERPAATTYDPYYGNVVQQGIILDKYFAMQDFSGLWPVMDYDPSQAAGAYLTWYEGIGDQPFNSLTQWGVLTMLGSVPNVFPYFQPTTVALFAQDTHDPAFNPVSPVQRQWIGGVQFSREEDFLTYFQNIAVQQQWTGAGCLDTTGAPVACSCTSAQTCTYDPRNIPDPSQLNQLVGPDGKRYIWSYIPDRNQWAVAQQDYNIVTNTIMINYNGDVVASQDDGNFPGLAYTYELPLKYTVDSFTDFN